MERERSRLTNGPSLPTAVQLTLQLLLGPAQQALTVSQWVAKVVMNGQIPVQYLLAVKLWQEAIATDAAASRNARDMQK
ncbi:TPA: hypothetical protein ACH3X2_010953 [Trebouxia sp. C0005]